MRNNSIASIMLKSSQVFVVVAAFLVFGSFSSMAQNGVYYIPLQKEADSVRAALVKTTNDSLKMSAYYLLSGYYTELNKDSSLYFAELQLAVAQKLGQKLWEANALFEIAYLTFGLGNYPRSLTAVTDGLRITDEEESEKGMWQVTTFSGDGSAYRARLFIASALHQIFAFLYYNVDNITMATSEHLTAIKIAESVDNKAELSLDYMSLGGIYMQQNKLDSSLLAENKALQYAYASNYKIYLGFILNQIGHVYLAQQNIDSAGKYYTIALQASKEQFNLKDQIDALIALAKLKRTIGQTDSSLFYGRQALLTSKKFELVSGINRSYNSLFSTYKLMGKQDSAYVYLQLAKSLGDSIYKAQITKTNEYQSLNLNEQLKLQEAEKAKIHSENMVRMYILIAGIAVLLLIAFLLFRNNRTRKKANDLLTIQKAEIEQQKEKVETTLAELKATQTQLIQSEKMASLGELTAGIAHEIQNPLNFVNNFSEVNKEMIDELQIELKSGNVDEAINISNDIKGNSEKINYHGKRADAIVKAMLQHSRTSSGKKELTDINSLCDEYLRLAYHGLRAKEKNFNATLETDYDETIGKVNIISQDIGRAVLNLITNAFYAVNEKQKAENSSYVPTVTIATKNLNNKIKIRVKDNGNGIPQNIIDKIFQPFFTTKPTGQGTGLGLSLAYDIIKAHSGEIQMESKEGEGTKFTISLPFL